MKSLWQKIYLSDWFDPIHSIYCKVLNFFLVIGNFCYWGWKLRNSQDWDNTSIYYLLELKLRRLRSGCYQNGNHVWSEKSREYKAISECIRLCQDMQNRYCDNLMKVEGMDKLGFGADGMFSNRMSKQENTWFKIAVAKDEQVQKVRKARLFELMNKWSDFWWN